MVIKRMINTRNDELRAFQTRLTTVGKIRLGVYNPEGRGRPQKLDTFRLTSADGDLIRAAAKLYGGTPTEWKPQGGGAAQWQVVTNVMALPVYVVNGQQIDPIYEAWAGGRTCVRRCDGEWNRIKNEECVCNGPTPPATKDLCKITTRVLVMLQEIPGIGSWMLETHGENAAQELSTPAPLFANARIPVPAMLRLRQEKRRTWNAEKNKFDTLDFYVPWLDINILTSQQIGIGGDMLTRVFLAGGAPAIGNESALIAIEAAPQTAPAATTAKPTPMVPASSPVLNNPAPPATLTSPAATTAPATPMGAAPSPVTPEEQARILQAIEKADLAKLEVIKDAMIKREIRDKAIQDAWVSKRAGWLAAGHQVAAAVTNQPPATEPTPSTQRRPPTRAEAAWQPPGTEGDMFEDRSVERPDAPATGADAWPGDEAEYAQAIARGADDAAIYAAGGPMHWLAGDDQAKMYAAHEVAGAPDLNREYQVGDEVTVGGLNFVKISDDPFDPNIVDAVIVEDPTGIDHAAVQKAADIPPDLGPVGSVDDEYNAVCSLAFTNGREWSTVQTHDAIKEFCDVGKVALATAAGLRALRVKMIEEPAWAPSV